MLNPSITRVEEVRSYLLNTVTQWEEQLSLTEDPAGAVIKTPDNYILITNHTDLIKVNSFDHR